PDNAITHAEKWDAVKILGNNAALDRKSPITETSASDVRRVMETNVIGSFVMQREAATRMHARHRGSIINVTSRNASVGVATMGAYAAAKGALLALTRAAAVEWAREGVRVNA